MNKLNVFVLASAVMALAATATFAQAPQQPAAAAAGTSQEGATAVLSATETWRPVASDLRAGGRLQIRATGQWRISQQFSAASDVAAYRALARDTGPDGYTDLPLSPQVILPSAPVGALIGRIGENGAAFLIGSQYDQPIESDGALFVSINDVADQFSDNVGRVAIQIAVSAPPPPEPSAATDEPGQAPAEDAQDQTTDGTQAPPSRIPWMLIGGAILAALLLLALIMRRPPHTTENDRRHPSVPQVTTRVVNDGVSGQSLTLTVRGRR